MARFETVELFGPSGRRDETAPEGTSSGEPESAEPGRRGDTVAAPGGTQGVDRPPTRPSAPVERESIDSASIASESPGPASSQDRQTSASSRTPGTGRPTDDEAAEGSSGFAQPDWPATVVQALDPVVRVLKTNKRLTILGAFALGVFLGVLRRR